MCSNRPLEHEVYDWRHACAPGGGIWSAFEHYWVSNIGHQKRTGLFHILLHSLLSMFVS